MVVFLTKVVMSKRIALIIDNNTYQDRDLARLKTPAANVHHLASVLGDPEIGNFDEVETLINQPSSEVRRHISDLFTWKKKQDVLLLYFSGHAVLDKTGQLYLATVDTVQAGLEETAIPTTYITDCIDRSFSQQQILLLDCYHCSLPGPKTKSQPGFNIGTATIFRGTGYRRVVLTATDTIQYVLTENDIIGQAGESMFTPYLIEGLQMEAADTNRDGQIGVGELYEYVYHQVVQHTASQKPRMWSYNTRDEFIIARLPYKFEQKHTVKWDLIFGAIMAPTVTIVIGGMASLSTSVGMAGLLLLIYAMLYWTLD
jgi:hypothetical protein